VADGGRKADRSVAGGALSAPVLAPANSTGRVLFASLIGTTIEFFDFYSYATAAVLVFPQLFFPGSDPTTAILQSFATFALAFVARPVGSALFGHFGDRIGRKATLVAALLTMGVSTVVIGLLPGYASIGVAAPVLLALCRLGQGLGLGGEWGGAVLLATEHAPPGKRAWFGMFPQLGAPLGFFLANGTFLLMSATLDDRAFLSWGWRLPFIGSAVLVAVGLWIRLRIQETPEFQRVIDRQQRVRLPMREVFARHPRTLLAGTFGSIATFLVFYLVSVFAMSWGTSRLGYSREQFLWLEMAAVVCFAGAIPLSAVLARRIGSRGAMLVATVAIGVYGLLFAPLFVSASPGEALVFLAIGMTLTGLTYGPIGTLLAQMFPAAVRYTGSSLCFNLSGILGASVAPYIATWLATRHGLQSVGYYLSAAALLTLFALLTVKPEHD
jgi:metabolite-proton symporter